MFTVMREIPQTSPFPSWGEESNGTEGGATLTPADLPSLIEKHADFVWRSLRRLGVPEATTDDAVQNVFLISQKKLTQIVVGRERAFLFSVTMNVASHVRRTIARRREELGEGAEHACASLVDPAPLADAQLDQLRARALLDEVLEAMEMDLRTAFVMFELEEMTMVEIADVLAIPHGTVASRLRRAREEFHKQAQRVRARVERRTLFPSSSSASSASPASSASSASSASTPCTPSQNLLVATVGVTGGGLR